MQGATAILRFASPQGYISNKGAALLAQALQPLLEDAGVRAIILTGGAPDIFIRHADVAQIARAAVAMREERIGPESFLAAPFQLLGQLLDSARKPVIAAINGKCMGGGLEIALACTTRIAARSVQSIGLPEIRIDIFPGAGGTQRLARVLGAHRARLFILEGRVVDAPTALSLGLVDALAEDALAAALDLAAQYARRPAEAIAAIMELTAVDDAAGHAREALAFANLLRDPAIGARLEQFTDQGEALDQLP